MKQVKITYKEPCIFLFFFLIIFGYLGAEMGLVNLLNTIMNTAYALLMDTVFYIMAISVIAGALGSVLIEFGVIALIHRMLSRFMEPVFNLPGASIMGVMTLCAAKCDEIEIVAEGVDAEKAVEHIENFLEGAN